MSFKVPSNPNHSMIYCLNDLWTEPGMGAAPMGAAAMLLKEGSQGPPDHGGVTGGAPWRGGSC